MYTSVRLAFSLDDKFCKVIDYPTYLAELLAVIFTHYLLHVACWLLCVYCSCLYTG
jgi:hypothetical protein